MAAPSRYLLDGLRGAGVDIDAVCRSVGLSPADLESDIDFSHLDRFLIAAWKAADNPAVGLVIGTYSRAERYGIVHFAAMASSTLGVALERFARYNRLTWGDYYQLEQRGTRATLRIEPAGPQRIYSRAKIDMDVAALCTFAYKLPVTPVVPLEINLRGPAPPYAALYKQLLFREASFEQPDHALVFRREDLQTPLISANPQLERLFEGIVEAALSAHDEHRVGPRVRVALTRMLRGEVPTLDAVAQELCMSSRTLQRKLLEEGARFSDLLDEARKELAQSYLESARTTSGEIATQLGFVDTNSFFRAFKRWTGYTPQAYRRWASQQNRQVLDGA